MSENVPSEEEIAPYTGENVIYREKGVTGLDVQRAADTLLRLGRKPSIAALREQLGGGSPNTLGPLLEKYWKSLGTRLPAGPDALERVPESLARLTEALWLRSIDEARERTKVAPIGSAPSQQALAAMEKKVTELTAALAETRARRSEIEAQLLASLRDRLELRKQLQQLMALLKAEQELRSEDLRKGEAQARESQVRTRETLELALRRLAIRMRGQVVGKPKTPDKQKPAVKPKASALATIGGTRRKRGKTRSVRRGLR